MINKRIKILVLMWLGFFTGLGLLAIRRDPITGETMFSSVMSQGSMFLPFLFLVAIGMTYAVWWIMSRRKVLYDKPLDIPEKRCERCEFYKMIDSGYGNCIGLPPIYRPLKPSLWERVKSRLFSIFGGIVYDIFEMESDGLDEDPYKHCICVPWTQPACSLFKYRKISA